MLQQKASVIASCCAREGTPRTVQNMYWNAGALRCQWERPRRFAWIAADAHARLAILGRRAGWARTLDLGLRCSRVEKVILCLAEVQRQVARVVKSPVAWYAWVCPMTWQWHTRRGGTVLVGLDQDFGPLFRWLNALLGRNWVVCTFVCFSACFRHLCCWTSKAWRVDSQERDRQKAVCLWCLPCCGPVWTWSWCVSGDSVTLSDPHPSVGRDARLLTWLG